jgi:small subunit ribosomal protein S7
MDIKVFGKWDSSGVVVSDLGLKGYMNLENRLMPVSFGRTANKRFGKMKKHVVERLVDKLAVTGHLKDSRTHKRVSGRDSGKKQRIAATVEDALGIIEKRTKQNPFQILVKAIENCAPREETTRIRQGGIIAHKSVDVAPQRRLDLALRFISHGAGQRAFKKRQSLEAALAEEIIAASNNDMKIYSISKKEELERVAASAR